MMTVSFDFSDLDFGDMRNLWADWCKTRDLPIVEAAEYQCWGTFSREDQQFLDAFCMAFENL